MTIQKHNHDTGNCLGRRRDAASVSADSSIFLVTPDEKSVAAIGPNPYDPTHRSIVAVAGRVQGRSIVADIQAVWCSDASRASTLE